MITNCAKIGLATVTEAMCLERFCLSFIFSQLNNSNCNRKTEPPKDPGNNDLFDDYHCLIVKSIIWSVYPVYPGSIQPNHLRTLDWSSKVGWSSITGRVAVESP